ncbi:purine nucleoside permease [Halovivax ruber XH-70]|uniref:Purine nucleoside permease n=1 Tax=Halovivax ruber (strain DSM 18193 / JCM 13892 / XH-70) TaxID=797302 RepID=L0IDQ8_HALRX|nr:purine nucleoside permease [Halovivax ruber]AGB16889.1 purine nucleoside permease [Halovivax ruber XH-70]
MATDRPTPEPLDSAASIAPAVLVLPAVAFDPPFDERELWLERLPIETAYEIPGADGPLYVTADTRVAVTTTGLGKAPAATTVAALWGAGGLDLSETYWLSAGIAGSAPARAALGSVVVADAILDWDRKHRWDPTELGPPTEGDNVNDPSPARDADRSAVEQLAYLPEDALFDVEPALVELARDAASDVALTTDRGVRDYQETYPDAPASAPAVDVGPTVTSDEFWHGTGVAREVDSLAAAYGIDPYVTTQMEDAATATALGRFDAADRYLSLRAVANYDRPAPGETVHDSFEGTTDSVALARENVVRVGLAVVDRLCELAARTRSGD